MQLKNMFLGVIDVICDENLFHLSNVMTPMEEEIRTFLYFI